MNKVITYINGFLESLDIPKITTSNEESHRFYSKKTTNNIKYSPKDK